MRVLVTGFGPFLSNDDNPSDTLARALDRRRARGVSFHARSPLPVEYGRAARIALRAADTIGADAIVAFGLAAGAPRIRIERRSANGCTSPHPDGAGAVRAGRPTVAGAPGWLSATLDCSAIHAALAARGVPTERSHDAGGYVCNDLFFRLLAARRRALFVHLPGDVDVARVAQPFVDGIARAVIASASHDHR